MAVISQIKATSDNVNYNIRDDYSIWGGRNLLRNTKNFTTSEIAKTRSTVPENGLIRLTPTTSAAYAKFIVDYLDYSQHNSGDYTISFDAHLADVESTYTNTNIGIYLGYSISTRLDSIFSSSYDRYTPMQTITSTVTENWIRYSKVITIPDQMTSGKATALTDGSQLSLEFAVSGSRKPVEVKNVKLEKGNKPTDWSPAPEDIARFIGNETIELYSE